MRCSACRTENAPKSKYCEKCGTPLALKCPVCAKTHALTAHFCSKCGASLHAGDTPVQERPSKRVASRDERKHATVLFADVVSSTELIAKLDPEQAMERLRPLVAAMCDAVERHDGRVVRTLGDGIMALFGAPHSQEGHALLACKSALVMQESLQRSDGPRIRVGLHSGEVVSGTTEQDREQGAHGITVHVASRLQQLAEPGGICLSEDCYRLITLFCEARPFGRHAVKGLPEPIETFSLVGLRSSVVGKTFREDELTSLRGRDAERAILQKALRQTVKGNARIVGICAPPGVGKSRLSRDFAEACRKRSIPVLEARAQIFGHATPLQPVLDFLRAFFRIAPTDGHALARRRIAARLLPRDAAFGADLPLLNDFLGVPDPAAQPSSLDPKAKQARLLDIMRRVVSRLGSAEPTVILIEDLHWLDEASKAFVATLVDAVPGTKVMVVLNYRPSFEAPWIKLPQFQQTVLAELGADDSRGLVDELVGDHPGLAEMKARIAERSGGNPFFAEELVRSLADSGTLIGHAGRYFLGLKSTDANLPATVQAVLGERIDRLPDKDKAFLQIAAIIGKDFPLALLEKVAGEPAVAMEEQLSRLGDAGLLQERQDADLRVVAFRHPLIQEVAYAAQLKTHRSSLHAVVAKAIEEFYEARLDETAGLLAYHFEAAGDKLSAATYAARAARWVGTTNSRQAIQHWHQVRSLMAGQGRSPANDALRIMASGQIAMFGWRKGMTAEEAKPFLQEALGWARETNDEMVQLLLATDGRLSVDADIYIARVREALSLAEGTGNIGRIATLNAFLAHAYTMAGLANEALQAGAACLADASEIGASDRAFLGFDVATWVRHLRTRALMRLGRFDEAEESLETTLEMARELSDPVVRALPHIAGVDLARCRHDATFADRHAKCFAEIAEATGLPYMQIYALSCRGIVHLITKNFGGAVGSFMEAISVARKASAAMELEPELLTNLAEAHYHLGATGLARSFAREAVDAARWRGARLAECRAVTVAAWATLAESGTTCDAEARLLFDRAEELLTVCGAAGHVMAFEHDRAMVVCGCCT